MFLPLFVRDKAGGYGIQALGGMLVEYVHGDFLNVVGFPLNHFCKQLDVIYNQCSSYSDQESQSVSLSHQNSIPTTMINSQQSPSDQPAEPCSSAKHNLSSSSTQKSPSTSPVHKVRVSPPMSNSSETFSQKYQRVSLNRPKGRAPKVKWVRVPGRQSTVCRKTQAIERLRVQHYQR